MTRLGVFGGSFDPVHNGHLRLAEEARERFGLTRVLFVPNRISPFKLEYAVTDGDVRVEILRAAVADNASFVVDDREVKRPGPSYTVDTLRAIQRENPSAELYFLTGTDAVQGLPGWHEPEALLQMAWFVAAARRGVCRREVIDALPATWGARVLFLSMPELDISATDLRARARDGRSVRYLVPAAVEAFIRERGLYLPNGGPAAIPISGE